MRLGTRWGFGSPPPAGVPDAIHPAIREAEASLGSTGEGRSWTLTWLEGRPIASLDDGTTVTLDGDVPHVVRATDEDDSDSW